jgi:putative transposase
MIVAMTTVRQAARVSAVTGWAQLPGKKPGSLTAMLDASDDFEDWRAVVEAVSVMFRLFEPGPDGELVPVPTGWTVRGARFEVEWPADRGLVRSHFGARRFAYNWALNHVKIDLDARTADPGHKGTGWDMRSLRDAWNQAKHQAAPWWADNSKEAYASGIADLAAALKNWSGSRNGTRKGRKVGFPVFKSKKRDTGRIRFTTGAMRLEDDRRGITVPVIGTLRSKENTRRLQRPLAQDRARLLNITLSEQHGRLYASACYVIRTPAIRPPARPGVRAGIDLGLRSMATVAATDGTSRELPRLAPLKAALTGHRQAGAQMSRRTPGSRGYLAAREKLTRLNRRAGHLRRETWHQFTRELVTTYGEVVIEDLDIAAMKKSMGRRAFRRSVSDTAPGMFRPMLAYKAAQTGTVVTVASRWYPSSQQHHGCGCRLTAPAKLAKMLICQHTGELVDRDENAAANLRDWPDYASCGLVEPAAPADTKAGGTTPLVQTQARTPAQPAPGERRRSPRSTGPRRVEARTDPEAEAPPKEKNPARGAAA